MSDNLQKYPDPKYDVFIAHSSRDGPQVDELVQKLESRGVRVCHPERDFLPGKLVTENMASAIALSRKTATFLTGNFLTSARCKQERAMAETKGIKSNENVLVDILVDMDKLRLPDWLLMSTYVEIKSPYFFSSLLKALEVPCVEDKKTYDDLAKENASLCAENATLHDEKILLMKTWKEKEQLWLSEKQALTSKLGQLEVEKQQLVNNKNDTDQKEQDTMDAMPDDICDGSKLTGGWKFVGATDFKEHVENHAAEKNYNAFPCDQWKTVPLNVAIAGEYGSGKSSFINAIRGLNNDDDGAGAVGVTETTREPMPYTHSDNENLLFWELPGIGTPNFPRHGYLEKVNFKIYDFFIIFSHARFTENDLWLAKEVNQQEKKFLFVRTKIDDALTEKRARPKTFNEAEVLKTIREDAKQNFATAGLTKYSIFLISNFETTKWDFPALTKHLIDELPALKREAMILSLRFMTGDIIKEKKRILQARIWKVAAASAARAAVPMPGLSMAVDIALLIHEVDFYKKQLGLDDESLRTVAEATGQTPNHLRQAIGAKIQSTEKWITTMLGTVGGELAGKEALRFIPFIGSFIAAGISFRKTYHLLNKVLNNMEVTAVKALEIAVQKNIEDRH